jgi:hypothetical protein
MNAPLALARVCVASVALLTVAGCGGGGTKAPRLSAAAGNTAAANGSQSAQGSSGSVPSSAAAAGPAAAPHACTLVTQQEATAALGADKGAGQESAPGVPGVGDCVYGTTTGAGVRLTVDASGVGKAIYDGDRSSYPTGSTADIPGVGDAAFEITTSTSQVTLYFYKGGTFVSITLDTGAATGSPKDKVVALATAAADRV